MQMDNMLVLLFMSIPFMVFLGLKYLTYKRQKKLEMADEINSILVKHGKTQVFDISSEKNDSDKDKAA